MIKEQEYTILDTMIDKTQLSKIGQEVFMMRNFQT